MEFEEPTTSGALGARDNDETLQKSPSSKDGAQPKAESQEEVECSVCRNHIMEPTGLSDCTHEFCYDCIIGWLTKGSGLFCPMCKTPVKYVQKKETGERITVEEITALKEPEATASEDLVTEKRIVSRKIRACRRQMNKMDELIIQSQRGRGIHTVEKLNFLKQKCVSQLNSLQMLREDIDRGAAKAMIVSTREFRRLVYERQVTAEGLPVIPRRVDLREFLEKIDKFKTVLTNYFNIELKSIPAKNQPRLDNSENMWHFDTIADVNPDGTQEIIENLFELFTGRGPNSVVVPDIEVAFNGDISPRVAGLFINEVKCLINSKMEYLEWCGAVKYRFALDLGGEAAEEDFVVVDDVEDEPPAESESDRQGRGRGPIFQANDVYNTQFDPRSFSASLGTVSNLSSLLELINGPLRLQSNSVSAFRPVVRPNASNATTSTEGHYWSDLTNTGAGSSSGPKPMSKSPSVIQLGDSDDEADNDDGASTKSSEDRYESSDDDNPIVVFDANSARTVRKRKSDTERKGELKRQKKELTLPVGFVTDLEELIHKYDIPRAECVEYFSKGGKAVSYRRTPPREGEEQNFGKPRNGPTSSVVMSEFDKD